MSGPERMFLPAMRGYMGDWTYYSCLMPMRQVAQRVRYADEVHENKGLSNLIQRRLDQGRGKKIAAYLETNEDRFFNALVVAVYDGTPTWHEFGDIRNSDRALDAIPEDTKYSLGFLSLDGSERLFALDGQHRLAGIKLAVAHQSSATDDEIAVIFVGHSNTEEGLRRTRKLFTTLNKTAKPVSKADIIILDESDAMAITTRRMVDNNGVFRNNRIAFEGQANIRPDDREHITTLINLYDVNTIVLTKVMNLGSPAKLKLDRPEDQALDNMLHGATEYFQMIGKYVKPFGDLLNASDREFPMIVARNRTSQGGNLLFRPIGQKMFAGIVAKLVTSKVPIEEAVKQAAELPLELTSDPYVNVLWEVDRGGIKRNAETHTRDVLLYMLGHGNQNERVLQERRGKFLDDPSAPLPMPIRGRAAGTRK
jgi:DNA sulfur modification protein DndB